MKKHDANFIDISFKLSIIYLARKHEIVIIFIPPNTSFFVLNSCLDE